MIYKAENHLATRMDIRHKVAHYHFFFSQLKVVRDGKAIK
ncbi:MAG: hypothetical protein ACJAY4_002321 [Cryomorphaceae bacterium]|jgi:hypothetical protein